MITGNHFFQDDNTGGNIRSSSLIIAANHPKLSFVGNYVDNCTIEWTNEHDATPDIVTGYSFGGMTITGNQFTSSDTASWFRWFSIKPHGKGHFINGLNISGNVFKAFSGPILGRVDGVDTSIAPLLPQKFRNMTMIGNTFTGVDDTFMNPATMEVSRTSAGAGWRTGIPNYLPFEAEARYVVAAMPDGQMLSSSNTPVYTQPYFEDSVGNNGQSFYLNWSQAVKGKVRVTVRCDDPD